MTEGLQLKGPLDKYDWFIVTEESPDTERMGVETFFLPSFHNMIGNRGYNPIALVKNILSAVKLFLRTRPKVVVSTGAAAVLPFCIIAKLFGTKLVFIESLARIRKPSLSGRIAYWFSDRFFVQWEKTLEHYGGKAEFKGALV